MKKNLNQTTPVSRLLQQLYSRPATSQRDYCRPTNTSRQNKQHATPKNQETKETKSSTTKKSRHYKADWTHKTSFSAQRIPNQNRSPADSAEVDVEGGTEGVDVVSNAGLGDQTTTTISGILTTTPEEVPTPTTITATPGTNDLRTRCCK